MAKKKNEGNSSAAAWLSNQEGRPHIDENPLHLQPIVDKLQFEVISDKQIKLTDEVAAAYIELPIFRGERSIRDSHVQRLRDAMHDGTFNPLLVILSTCELHGVTYKINGQHTCWAKYYCSDYTPMVREVKYRVKDEDQLRQLYATYDRNMARSDQHITLIELANNDALKDIPVNIIKFLAPCLRFWLYQSSDDRRRCTPENLSSLIAGKYLQLFILVGHFYREYVAMGKETAFFRRIAVGAAVFETFNKVPTLAPQFWKPVIDGIGLDTKFDARWQLRAFLQTTVINSASGKNKRSTSDETMYNHCIPAFNKWRKNEEVRAIRPTTTRVRAI
jgi:hypothetical protein